MPGGHTGSVRSVRKVAALTTVVVAVLLLVFALLSDSWLEDSARGTDGAARLIDERRGHVGRVALGDRERVVSATLGQNGQRAGGGGDPLATVRAEIGGPVGYAFPAPCDDVVNNPPGAGVMDTAYRGAAATFCRGRAFVITVSSRGSRTKGGAIIGQRLRDAHRSHPTLRCASVTNDGAPVFRYCTGRVAENRYLWLGQDPVSSIAISTVRMGHCC